MVVNVPGLVAIIVFYVLLLVIGIYAARKRGKGVEEMMLAGRNLGWFLGICTMTGSQMLTQNHWCIRNLDYNYKLRYRVDLGVDLDI